MRSMELLESRSLLAIAAFDINLYRDNNGIPGALIAEDTVQAGDSFFLEITAEEFHPFRTGLARVALNITWDPAVLQSLNTSFAPSELITEHLPFFQTGILHNSLGKIKDLGGSAFVNAGREIGGMGPERFALLHFQAMTSVADSPVVLSQGASSIVTRPLATLLARQIDFDAQTITVLPAEVVDQLFIGPSNFYETRNYPGRFVAACPPAEYVSFVFASLAGGWNESDDDGAFRWGQQPVWEN